MDFFILFTFCSSRGVDYSSTWSNNFHSARETINHRLHLLHPSHMKLLDLCQHTYPQNSNKCIGDILMVDFKKLRSIGPLDQHQLKNNVTIELEKTQKYIKNIWFTNFLNIFADTNHLKSIPYSLHDSFYDSAAVLASNQVSILDIFSSQFKYRRLSLTFIFQA
jgi:hypothetical protein